MKCINCNANLIEGTDFCPYCGTENHDNAKLKTKFCPSCQKIVHYDCNICVCGYRFVEVIQPKAKEAPKEEAGCWSAFSKVSNILGTISLCIFWIPIIGLYAFLPGVPGIVFGALGKHSNKENVKERAGSGLLKSILGTVFGILGFIFLIMIISSAAN